MRQLPLTVIDQRPRISPFKGCRRNPGMSMSSMDWAVSRAVNCSLNRLAWLACTPDVLPVSYRRRKPLCRNVLIMQEMYHVAHYATSGLTPELSRAERGRREPVLRGCLRVSTKPRDGVGLNDWLGAEEPGEGEVIQEQAERPKPGCMCAPGELSAGRRRSDGVWGERADRQPTGDSEADERNACDA